MRLFALPIMLALLTGCVDYFHENFFVETRDARLRDCPARADDSIRPVPVMRQPPWYPEGAMRDGVEGRVLVEYELNSGGRVTDARAIALEPSQIFNSAAVASVLSWEFCPIRDGDTPYVGPFRVAIPFRLQPTLFGS